MKNLVSPHLVASLIFGMMAPLSAQNLSGNPSLLSRIFKPDAAHVEARVAGGYQPAPLAKGYGEVSAHPPVYTIQDMQNLKLRGMKTRPTQTAEKARLVRTPSSYRKSGSQSREPRYEVTSNSMQQGLAVVSLMYRELGKPR